MRKVNRKRSAGSAAMPLDLSCTPCHSWRKLPLDIHAVQRHNPTMNTSSMAGKLGLPGAILALALPATLSLGAAQPGLGGGRAPTHLEPGARLGVRLKVSVRRGVSPHFFRGEGRELAEKGAGLTPAPSVPDTFNRPRHARV
jgi:hypothetical protein